MENESENVGMVPDKIFKPEINNEIPSKENDAEEIQGTTIESKSETHSMLGHEERRVSEIEPDIFRNGQHKKKCQCPECVSKRLMEPEKPKMQENEKTNDGSGKEVLGNGNGNSQSTANPNDENPELSGWAKTETGQAEVAPEIIQPEEAERKRKKVSGAMFLMGLEYIFPKALKLVGGFLDKKYRKLNAAGRKALSLADETLEELEEWADEVAEIIFEDMPPVWGFVILYSFAKLDLVDELRPEHFDT